MSWWKKALQFGAPALGAVGGSLLGPALGVSGSLGGAIGGGLGGVLGNEAFGRGGLGGDLLEGGLGAAGGGLAGNSIADWAGVSPGAASAAGGAIPGQSGGSIDELLRTIGQGSATEASIAPGTGSYGALDAAGQIDHLLGGAIPGATAGGAAAGGAGGSFLDSVLGFAKDNPVLTTAGIGIGGQLLGPSLANLTTPTYPGQQELEKNAGLLNKQATAALNGGLTPASQNALNDAITTIKAQYANLGLSGSTMEAQDIAAAKERAIGSSVNEGLTELGLSTDMYDKIMGYAMQNDNELSSAITGLMGQLGSAYGGQRQNQSAP